VRDCSAQVHRANKRRGRRELGRKYVMGGVYKELMNASEVLKGAVGCPS
jgi:hypothetical protein